MTEDAFTLPNGADRSKAFDERAMTVFPGGVSHNIRAIDPHPIYIDRAQDSRVWDVDGNEYVDFWMNHLTSVLGHAHPAVVEAVHDQVDRGLHYGAPNELALDLGREVQAFVPSAERVRFCASGTEATMYAVRLARAYTGRPHVLKVEGGWHGGNTDLTAAIHTPFDAPASAGLPPGAADHVHGFPLNDREAVVDLLDAYAVGGIIIEPMLLAGGGVEADQEFLQFLRDESEDRGFVLIFDEVVTGFRVAPGTYQARVGITPDLTTLGKFLGGGLPVGAVVGRADLFEAARPDYDGPAPVLAGGGTFSMNPMTAAAGLASLDVVATEPVFDQIEARGARVRDGLAAIVEELGLEAVVLGMGSMFIPHFAPADTIETVEDVESRTDRAALRSFHRRLLGRGYYFLPGHTGAISSQTTDEQLDGFLDAAADVAGELHAEGWL